MSLRVAVALVLVVLSSSARPAVPPPDPSAVADVKAGHRTVANAAWWGFDPVNSTAALQAAIDSGARKVVVPNVHQDWIVDPIALASDQEIVFERGVVVAARKGGFPGLGDSLFRAVRAHNLTLRGYGATFKMQKPDYTKGEWRMCLDLQSCTNVKVLGLTLRDSGGDGIYVGSTGGDQPYCRDVVVRDCVMDNNRRQGMSVITAVNLLVERCVFRNTSGTAPRAGVDLEPNGPTEKLVNCVFRDCVMEDNDGPGILVYMGALDETTEPISVRFDRCRVRGGKSEGIDVSGTRRRGPLGLMTFAGCTVEGCQGSGASFYRKSSDAVRVRFERCAWRNVARMGTGAAPILLAAWTQTPEQAVGGIDFIDCSLDDDLDRPFLAVVPLKSAQGVAGIRGTLTVRNLHGVRTSLGASTRDVSLEVK